MSAPALAGTIAACTQRLGRDLVVILDQFEEYFVYHPRDDGDATFAAEFPRAVNQAELAVSFLVSIREDALARLDRFKGQIPSLFGNYLRLDRLDRERSEEHTSELQSRRDLVCRLLLEKKKKKKRTVFHYNKKKKT